MTLELRQLRYFVALAEELHFGRAAERLHIVQPALSMQIGGLERQLGVRLFDRTKRKVDLTDAGALFLNEVRLTLQQAERAEMVARQAGRGERGRIAVGYGGSVVFSSAMSALLFAFRQAYPEVELQLSEMPTAEQLAALVEGKLDIGFVRPPFAGPATGLSVLTLAREKLVVALHPDNPLAALERIPVRALADEPFISYSTAAGTGLLSHLVAVCRRGGFEPRIAQTVPQIATVVSLVAAGLGVSLVPDSLRQMPAAAVAYRDLADVEEWSELSLAYRRNERSASVRALIRQAQARRKVDPAVSAPGLVPMVPGIVPPPHLLKTGLGDLRGGRRL
jgi:DNA-binding transcriptional LysR family regulator